MLVLRQGLMVWDRLCKPGRLCALASPVQELGVYFPIPYKIIVLQ